MDSDPCCSYYADPPLLDLKLGSEYMDELA